MKYTKGMKMRMIENYGMLKPGDIVYLHELQFTKNERDYWWVLDENGKYLSQAPSVTVHMEPFKSRIYEIY